MLKKGLKQLIAAVTAAVMLLSSVPAYAADTAATSDFSNQPWVCKLWYHEGLIGNSDFADRLNKADDNEKFECIVYMKTTDEHSAQIAQEIYNRTGLTAENTYSCSEEEFNAELAKWSEEDEEQLVGEIPETNPHYESLRIQTKDLWVKDRVINKKQKIFLKAEFEVRKEFFDEYNSQYLDSLGLNISQEDIIKIQDTKPEFKLSLTKADIAKAAANDNVNYIYLLELFTEMTIEFRYDKYTDRFNYELNNQPNNYDGVIPVCVEVGDTVFTEPCSDTGSDNSSYKISGNKYKDYKYLSNWVIFEGGYLVQNQPMFEYGENKKIYCLMPMSKLKPFVTYHGDVIKSVDWWDISIFKCESDETNEFDFTSEDALRILRSSVGLERKEWNVFFDVNQDGSVDSLDSLIALRSSVELESVQYYVHRLYPLYDVQQFGLPTRTAR